MIDLHCHSIFSDGSLSPEELIALAEEGGLSALALTDHDTTEGLPRFFAAAEKSSVTPIVGVELSTEEGGLPVHILGYGFDPEHRDLQTLLDWVKEGRATRNHKILEKLQTLGYELTFEEVLEYSPDGVVGRPHFAQALMDRGHFSSKEKVFKQLLGRGCAAYVNRHRLSSDQCIDLITKAGGMAVLAHPGQLRLTNTRLRKLLRSLKAKGLGGMEVVYSSHKPHQVAAYEQICHELDLLPTGGSDFHGALTPDLYLGRGFGAQEIPDVLLENLLLRING